MDTVSTTSSTVQALLQQGGDYKSFFNKIVALVRNKYLLVAIIASAIFYSPFLWGSAHTYIRVVDNLDIAVPYNSAIGYFYRHPAEARHLLLAGNVPISSLFSFTWPLTLLNVMENQFSAYFINDLIVRTTGAVGMFFLAIRLGIENRYALLIALIFGFSLTVTTMGLSVAAMPAVLYLAQLDAEAISTFAQYIVLVFFGWNTSLAHTGLFLLIAISPLQKVLFGPGKRSVIRTCAAYAFGLLLGNAGLAASVLGRVPSHRDAWPSAAYSAIRTLRTFAHFQIHPYEYYYHTTGPVTFLMISAIWAFVVTRNKTIRNLIVATFLIDAFNCLLLYAPISDLRNSIGGLAKTLNLGRMFFLNPFLVILAWVVAMSVSSAGLRRVLVLGAGLQMVLILCFTPHLYNSAMDMAGIRINTPEPDFPLPQINSYSRTFAEYYKKDDYGEIRKIAGNVPTLSVGLDPMVAVMNHISAVDGYYTTYPLSYKMRFRPVIAAQLSALPVYRDEFDHWGNHIYTFTYAKEPVLLNYCAAAAIGAGFVISRFDLTDTRLRLLKITDKYHLRLYSIAPCG